VNTGTVGRYAENAKPPERGETLSVSIIDRSGNAFYVLENVCANIFDPDVCVRYVEVFLY
jgi:hypothetical protein